MGVVRGVSHRVNALKPRVALRYNLTLGLVCPLRMPARFRRYLKPDRLSARIVI